MTKIDYCTPIHQPITQYETVQELLHRSEEAAQAVGQTYTINTFDLGVCMKGSTFVWRHPDKYQKHIIIPGPFHTETNYIGMLTDHKARGSEYAEILLEAGLAEKGCLKHIISGKAFTKSIFCLKASVESLGWLFFDVFNEQTNSEVRPQALLDTILTCNRQSIDSDLNDESTNYLIQVYAEFQEQVRQGHLGKTGRFWISLMGKAKLVFILNFAVKTNNRKLFYKCNGEMTGLFFAYVGVNYCRLEIVKNVYTMISSI